MSGAIHAAMQEEYYVSMVEPVISLIHSQIIFMEHLRRVAARFAASLTAHFVALGPACPYLSAKRKAAAQIWYTKYSMWHLTSQAVWGHICRTAQTDQANLSHWSR
jgi:hypothetical protein